MRLGFVASFVALVAAGSLLAEPVDGPAEGPGAYAALPECDRPCGVWSVDAEYLVWFLREGRVPALLTTSSLPSMGRLGQPDTQVLFGDDRLTTRHDDRFVGTRFTLGWRAAEDGFGAEVRAFFLERDSTYFKAISDGSTLLAEPFTGGLDGAPLSEIIAGPTPQGWRDGAFIGYTRVELFGEEANAVVPLCCGGAVRLDGLVGARFLQMRDRLNLTATGRLLADRSVLFGLEDQFETHNAFYGGQLGLRGEWTCGRFYVAGRAATALGGDDQLVRASGRRIYNTPFVRNVTPYGLYVQPSNAGSTERGELDWVADVGIDIGWRLTSWARVHAGYTFLFWNNPIRAGDQVDPVINPATASLPARPEIPFKTDPFWAQGVSVGLELCW